MSYPRAENAKGIERPGLSYPAVREDAVPRILRRLVVVGTPFLLGILEIFHPTNFTPTILSALQPEVNWWLFLHVIQLPLFGLMALAVLLLINGSRGLAATTCRVAMGIFVVFYSAADAILGVATGVMVQNARGLPPEQQAAISNAIQKLWANHIAGNFSLLGRNISFIAFTGAFAWGIGVLAAIYVLYRFHTSPLPLFLLAGAALFFGLDHAPPFGPIGLACFFLATVHLEFLGRSESLQRRALPESPRLDAPPAGRGD